MTTFPRLALGDVGQGVTARKRGGRGPRSRWRCECMDFARPSTDEMNEQDRNTAPRWRGSPEQWAHFISHGCHLCKPHKLFLYRCCCASWSNGTRPAWYWSSRICEEQTRHWRWSKRSCPDAAALTGDVYRCRCRTRDPIESLKRPEQISVQITEHCRM